MSRPARCRCRRHRCSSSSSSRRRQGGVERRAIRAAALRPVRGALSRASEESAAVAATHGRRGGQ